MELRNHYPHVSSLVRDTIFALRLDKFEQIAEVVSIKARGGDLPKFAALPAPTVQRVPGNKNTKAMVVMPLFGLISYRVNMISEFSGGTSIEKFTTSFREFMADSEIGTIVLDIDSPGGTVPGVVELASEIFAARRQKKIIAVANPGAASAAYWLGSAAGEFYVMPSGDVGSIGVYALHEDVSGALDKAGVKVTMISAGKYKTENHPSSPLTDYGRASIQKRVDEFYDMFTAAVARGRGVKQQEVVNGFGEGRMVSAKDALRFGMVDGIATLDEVLQRIASGSGQGGLSIEDRRRARAYKSDEANDPVVRESMRRKLFYR